MKRTLILSLLVGILLLGGLIAATALADENRLAGELAQVAAKTSSMAAAPCRKHSAEA